jgi:hypothetical protein
MTWNRLRMEKRKPLIQTEKKVQEMEEEWETRNAGGRKGNGKK